MNTYERYCKIRDLRNMKDAQVASKAGIGKSTFSDWKNERSKPKDDKMKKIATALDVTLEYLKGDTHMIICPICSFHDDPLWEPTRKEHEEFHNKFLKVKEKYPFFTNYAEASKIRDENINTFRNPQKSIDDRLKAFDECLMASFSLEIAKCNYNIDHLDYDEFCKNEVSTLEVDWIISEEFIDRLVEKYGIDKNFLSGNEQLLARASKNDTLMQIIRYTEQLTEPQLETLVIQIKALAEQNNRG